MRFGAVMKLKIFSLLLFVAGLVALTTPGQSPKDQTPAKQAIHKQRELPIVDYPEKDPAAATLPSQQKVKARRYDRQSSEAIREAYRVSGRTWSTDWSKNLEALPFEQSDVVLIGGVMSGKAYLSGDKTGIFPNSRLKLKRF